MQKGYCQIHERDACVVDLDHSKLLCEKCALFDPEYKHHEFIDLGTLPNYAKKLYQTFKAEINALNINVDKDAVSKWRTVEELAKKELNIKVKDINMMYDDMIAEIERERKERISNVVDEIEKIVLQSNESVDLIVGEKYQKLYCKNKYLLECLESEKYLQMSKELLDKSSKEIIASCEKDLSMIELDLKQRLNMMNVVEAPVDLGRRRASIREQMLLPTEGDFAKRRGSVRQEMLISNQGFNLNLNQLEFVNPPNPLYKTDRPIAEDVKGENLNSSTRNPETERFKTSNSVDLSMTASEIDSKRKNCKKVQNKSQIKSLVIKNTIKEVQLTELSMSNRQVLEAIKKCTTNTFVHTVDVSNNQITCELIGMLKRLKGISKYLKKIVMRGMKITDSVLKKEGIGAQTLKEGKYKIGDIQIVV